MPIGISLEQEELEVCILIATWKNILVVSFNIGAEGRERNKGFDVVKTVSLLQSIL